KRGGVAKIAGQVRCRNSATKCSLEIRRGGVVEAFLCSGQRQAFMPHLGEEMGLSPRGSNPESLHRFGKRRLPSPGALRRDLHDQRQLLYGHHQSTLTTFAMFPFARKHRTAITKSIENCQMLAWTCAPCTRICIACPPVLATSNHAHSPTP